MASPATLMEYGWSLLDASMSNPADYEMMIGSNKVDQGMDRDHPELAYRIVHDSFAKVVAMLRGTCTLRSVLATNSDNAAVLDKVLMVSLDSTSINPRPVAPSIPDSAQRLNWYVDRVDIELGFPVAPAGLERSADVPNTSSLKGQSQSSISQTLSVGFFGDTATGSYSKTWSHSFAIQLEDFGIERKSVGADVLQTLHLEMSTSAVYAQTSDMIDGPAIWNGTLGATALRTPPETAITNVDIPTQCIYQIPGSEKGTFLFRIKLTPRFAFHHFRARAFGEESPDMQTALKQTSSDPMEMLAMGFDLGVFPFRTMVDTEIATPDFIWEFPIDFSKVGMP
jgi:hypothetical protein